MAPLGLRTPTSKADRVAVTRVGITEEARAHSWCSSTG